MNKLELLELTKKNTIKTNYDVSDHYFGLYYVIVWIFI